MGRSDSQEAEYGTNEICVLFFPLLALAWVEGMFGKLMGCQCHKALSYYTNWDSGRGLGVGGKTLANVGKGGVWTLT